MAPPLDLQSQTHVPIAQLHPAIETQSSAIKGIVSLIWPYSSVNRSLSLLLVESDFRLRRQKGQVRITFNGSSAKAVAKSGISSGDVMLLSLEGVQWAKDGATLMTPGRSLEWELKFEEKAVLRVRNLSEN